MRKFLKKVNITRIASKLVRPLLFLIGIVLIADTILVSRYSNFNFGVVLPCILGTPLLICAIFYRLFAKLCTKRAFFRVLRMILLIGYTAFTLAALVTFSIIKHAEIPKDSNSADVIIVLGAGIHGEYVTPLLARRLNVAVEYKKNNPSVKIVVSGGQGSEEAITEAEAMERYLLSHGIDAADIIKEEASKSTQENFRFTKRILDDKYPNGASCLFVTSDFHVFRAERVAAAEGLITAEGLPSSTIWYIRPNCYLREILAVWAYGVLGWF